mmetsp:Transcript_102769/g.257773  ORF Transcript_102769/g.257773 Transcript_102769/m.257773 type:complete len:85 (+) Transcript_102769:172-426(+)
MVQGRTRGNSSGAVASGGGGGEGRKGAGGQPSAGGPASSDVCWGVGCSVFSADLASRGEEASSRRQGGAGQDPAEGGAEEKAEG